MKNMTEQAIRSLGGCFRQNIGTHSVEVDGDVVFYQMRGIITLDDMKEMVVLQARVRRERGRLFVLYDSRENTGLHPAARKYVTDHATPETSADAAASFGASFSLRVLVNMFTRVQDALGKEGPRTMLFDTEADARRYLEQERARLGLHAA